MKKLYALLAIALFVCNASWGSTTISASAINGMSTASIAICKGSSVTVVLTIASPCGAITGILREVNSAGTILNTITTTNTSTGTGITLVYNNITSIGSKLYRVDISTGSTNSCKDSTAHFNITVDDNPTVNITTPGSKSYFCQNGSLTLTANGINGTATGTLNYAWNAGGSSTGATNTVNSIANYVVTVTDGNSCSSSANLNVSQSNNPTVNITTPGSKSYFCQNGSLTLTANGINGTATGTLNYAWNAGGSSTGATNTVNSIANYVVTVTDGNSCSSSANLNVSQSNNPTVNITPTGASAYFCQGKSVTLTANGSGGTGTLNYSWNGGGVTSNTYSVSTVSTIPVTVTDANGCSVTASQAVSQSLNPTVANNTTSYCGAGSRVISPIITNGTSTTISQYIWSPNLSTAASLTTPNLAQGTSNNYGLTVIDGNNCSASANKTVVNIT